MTFRRTALLAAALALPLGLNAFVTTTSVQAAEAAVAEGTIVDVLAADGRFTTLIELVKAEELAEALQSEGPFTLFAPTDEAFAAMDQDELKDIIEDENVKAMLLVHVVPKKLMAADIVKMADGDTEIETLSEDGTTLLIEPDEDRKGALVINSEGAIIETDIAAGNGVIHVIDLPLLP